MSDSMQYCFLQVWTAQSDQEAHDEFFKTFNQTIKACAFQDIAAETVYDSGRLTDGAFCLIKLKKRASVCIKAAKAILKTVLEIEEVKKGQLQLPERQILLCKKTDQEQLVIEEKTCCVDHWPRITCSGAAGLTCGSLSIGGIHVKGSFSHLQFRPNSQILLGYKSGLTKTSTAWETISRNDLLCYNEKLISNEQGRQKLAKSQHRGPPRILILMASSNSIGSGCSVALCDFNVNSIRVVVGFFCRSLIYAADRLAMLMLATLLFIILYIPWHLVRGAASTRACCIQL